jgi:hypothetical protein
VIPAVNQGPLWTGNHTFSPASGVGAVFNQATGNNAINVNGPIENLNTTNTYLAFNSSGANFGLIQSGGAQVWQIGYGTSSTTAGTSVIQWNNTGNVIIGTPASGVPLTIDTVSSGFGFLASDGTNTQAGLGFSGGHATQVGSYGSFPLQLLGNGSVVATLNSGVVVGSPTGGDEGAGTINTTGVFVNGASLTSAAGLRFAKGNFTCTSGGCTGSGTNVSFSSRGSAGNYAFAISGFSSSPGCAVSAINPGAVAALGGTPSTTNVTVLTFNSAVAAADAPFSILCIGT